MSNTDIRVLDLFSGIGGFSYGLKQAGGFRTVGYVEREPYCQNVLVARMQDGQQLDPAPIFDDICNFDGSVWRGTVDLVTSGWPCQPASTAGRREGADDERWMWPEVVRLLREIKPRWFMGENVRGLLSADDGRLFGGVLRDLARLGYSTRYSCISAEEMGDAPHKRDRVWIISENVADSASVRQPGPGKPGDASNKETGRNGETTEPVDGCERYEWGVEPGICRVAPRVPHRLERLTALGGSLVPPIVTYLGNMILEASR